MCLIINVGMACKKYLKEDWAVLRFSITVKVLYLDYDTGFKLKITKFISFALTPCDFFVMLD